MIRIFAALSLTVAVAAGAVVAQAPEAGQPVGTMGELMASMVYPAANDLLLYAQRAPQNDKEWMAAQRAAILLGESGNVLMMRGRARDQGEWMKDARALVDAGLAAVKATRAKDMPAVMALNEQIVNSCITCHKKFRSSRAEQDK